MLNTLRANPEIGGFSSLFSYILTFVETSKIYLQWMAVLLGLIVAGLTVYVKSIEAYDIYKARRKNR